MRMLLLAASAMLAASDVGSAGGAPPRPWETPAWEAFRTTWDRLRSAPDEAALDAVLATTPDLERRLAAVIPPALARRLAGALTARGELRRRAVARTMARLRIDWPALLRADTAQLSAEHALLVELRRLRWEDPWIEQRLAADTSYLAAIVKTDADQTERTSTERKLVREARALLERVRPSLPPPAAPGR